MELKLFFEFDIKIHLIKDPKLVYYNNKLKKFIFNLFSINQQEIDFALFCKYLMRLSQSHS